MDFVYWLLTHILKRVFLETKDCLGYFLIADAQNGGVYIVYIFIEAYYSGILFFYEGLIGVGDRTVADDGYGRVGFVDELGKYPTAKEAVWRGGEATGVLSA